MGLLFRDRSKVPTPWWCEDNEARSHRKHAVAAAEVRQSLDERGWLVKPDRGWKSSKAELFPADIPCMRFLVRPDGGNLDSASSEKLPLAVASVTAAKLLLLPPTCLCHHCPATNQHGVSFSPTCQPSICGKRLPLPPPRPPSRDPIFSTPFPFQFRLAANVLCRRPSRRRVSVTQGLDPTSPRLMCCMLLHPAVL